MNRSSERLADAQVDAPPPALGHTVDEKPVDRCQLVAEVGANRTDPGVVSKARPDIPEKIAEEDLPRPRPDVAGVHEADQADRFREWQPQLRIRLEQAQASDGSSV